MNKDLIRQYLREIETRTLQIDHELDVPDLVEHEVNNSIELTAALLAPGFIRMNRGVYPGSFQPGVSDINLRGTESEIQAPAQTHGLSIQYSNFAVDSLILTSASHIAPLIVGSNLNTDLNLVPRNITIENVTIPTYEGKRGFEIHGGNVRVLNCNVRDVRLVGTDDQAIWIGNSPGDIEVNGGVFESADENFLVGGDWMRLTNTIPRNIRVYRALFTKPLSWRNVISVKNLCELKTGEQVEFVECTLENCWQSGQGGYAFVFTPASGGQVQVVVRNCTVRNVGCISNISGRDSAGQNTVRTRVEFQGGNYVTANDMGGNKAFALVIGGPESLIINNVYFRTPGARFLQFDTGHVDNVEITNSDFNLGTSYGITIGPNHWGDNSLGIIGNLRIENNTIYQSNASFRARYPNNIYI